MAELLGQLICVRFEISSRKIIFTTFYLLLPIKTFSGATESENEGNVICSNLRVIIIHWFIITSTVVVIRHVNYVIKERVINS